MFPGSFPLGALIAFFVGVDATLLFPLPSSAPALQYHDTINGPKSDLGVESLPCVPIVYLGLPQPPGFTPPNFRYRRPLRTSMSAMFTMELRRLAVVRFANMLDQVRT